MGIPLTAHQVNTNYQIANDFLDNQVQGISAWRCNAGFTRYDVTYGPLLRLLQARGVDYQIPAPATPPVANPYSQNWYVNHPFSNLSQYAFLDINWVEMLQVHSGNQQPATISIGTPTVDPGAGLHLKLMLVQQSPTIINDAILYTTLRVIKVTAGAAAVGTYTWPLTITNTEGMTITVNLSLVVA
jgi:hypothetical protein